MEACTIWGRGALSVCFDFSLAATTCSCTESVIVVASTLTTTGWVRSSVSVPVSIARDIGFCGGDGGESFLGGGRHKG